MKRLPSAALLCAIVCPSGALLAQDSREVYERETRYRRPGSIEESRSTVVVRETPDDEDLEYDRDFHIDPGTWELSLGGIGAWQEQDGSDVETITVGANLRLGFFFTEWFELAAKARYTFQETEFGDTTETETHSVLAGPELIFNFPTETRVLPYFVGSGGVVYSEFRVDNDTISDEVGAFWEAGGGLRVFVTRSAAVDMRVVFQQLLFEDEGDINGIVGSAGISIFF